MTLLALFAGRLGELALAYNRVSSVVSGPLLGIFLLGILTRRATAPGSILGAVAGMAAVGLASLRTEWSFFNFGPIGVLTTITAGYLASLLTRPPKPEQVHGLVRGEP